MDACFLLPVQPDLVPFHPDLGPLHLLDGRFQGTDAYHPAALISYPHWTRKRFQPGEDVLVFGDSGGYDGLTRGLKLDPCRVIRWQIDTVPRGAILDVPPFAEEKHHRAVPWDKALAETVRNVRLARPIYEKARREGSPFQWWGIIQGETREQMEQWYRAVSRVYPFTDDGEGWAVKPHPIGQPGPVALALGFLRDHGITRAHLLATGGKRALCVLACLGPEAGMEKVTFDSSSPVRLGKRFSLMVPDPDGLGWTTPGPRTEWPPCSCAMCELSCHEPSDRLRGIADDIRGLRFSGHNQIVTVRTFEALRREADRGPLKLLEDRLAATEYAETMAALGGGQ